MTTQTSEKRIQAGYEPIEGYVLEKLIGRGGYGEVWRAEAPGGLKKAVKFVFGKHDERRAAQELKSLERIKRIQHPFILTLERFEFIENQLVIITELAEGSLEDVYSQHRERGSCGIPREVLLGHMRDAADALDYLHQLYKLQHLDIKPANLLLVGGRVKVADFGLLKDLGSDVDCSMVGGLTPIYAPPEVFDGRPSMHSDQYSLAVMYQELLTSARPFSGRTIAQLATQHVHNAPNLDPLPACDRPCVARALEKSPDRRFDSCSDFVDKLIHAQGRATAVAAEEAQQESVDVVEHSFQVENLPELGHIVDEGAATQQTQVLVVGLGGTGAECIEALRGRVGELGAASPVTLHSVMVDTDMVAAKSFALADPTDHIRRCQTIHIPLRSANDYRESATTRFGSISRRWIYNVPRNCATGGMRPLGRLALVDHGETVFKALTESLKEFRGAVSSNANARVYVIGSIAGGTGSGIFVDIVYMIRHLLDNSAMENVSILSLLSANEFRGDPSRPIALHATKSALKEIAHFLKPGNGYPGDPGAGWPSVPAARTPLHEAYVVAPSDAHGSPTQTDSIVDYLWTDANVCGKWFENGRRDESNQTTGNPCIRSLAVVQLTDSNERQSSLLAPYAAKTLLFRWLGAPKESEEAAQDFQSRIARRCYLEGEPIRSQVEVWFGATKSERRKRLLEHIKTVDPASLREMNLVRSHLVKWLSQQVDQEQSDVIADQAVQQVMREMKLRLQDGRLDLSSSIAGLKRCADQAKSLAEQLQRESDEAFQRLDVNAKATAKHGAAGPTAEAQRVCDIGERLLEIVATRVSSAIATTIESKLTMLAERYSDASGKVAQGIQKLSQDAGWSHDPWESMEEPIRAQLPKIVERMHQNNVASWLFNLCQSPKSVSTSRLVADLTSGAGKVIRDCIGAPIELPRELPRELPLSDSTIINGATTATGKTTVPPSPTTDGESGPTEQRIEQTTYLTGMIESMSMSQTHSWSATQNSEPMSVEAALKAVRPPLLDCGGKQRLYLICRSEGEKKRLEAQLPDSDEYQVTTIVARAAAPMLVHEAQQIELKNVLAWLDALTGDDGKISARLASRSDIEWT